MQLRSALVVGGGVAGMSAALMLHRGGTPVQIVDADPHWKMAGAGLTLTAPTLRAFQRLGILEAVKKLGHTHPGIRVHDVSGRLIQEVRSPALVDADVPGAGGILRPVLHSILSEAVRAAGIDVRLGRTVTQIEENADRMRVRLDDGTVEEHDLLVGADGLFSGTRALLFPEASGPAFTGQACWRLTIPRPSEIDRRHFFLGGPVKVGLTPVAADRMYLFLLEHVPDNPRRAPETQYAILARLLEGFGGVVASIRAALSPTADIVYRPLESHLLRRAWWTGRAILIGDAAHATTPQLASGAGMAAEDGIVLAEEIARADSLEAAFAGFMRRRFDRCRLVVENSLEIGRLEVMRAPATAQTAIVEASLRTLASPI